MFERFAERAIMVVIYAQEETRRLGHNYVGTEQLLLGLMNESHGRAGKALLQLGIDLNQVRQAVETVIGRGSGEVKVEIPFTERAQNTLQLALETAQECNAARLDTGHLLLGLLKVDGAVAKTVLQNLGVDLSELRSQLLQGHDADDPMDYSDGWRR